MWGGRGGFAPFSSLSCASGQGRRAAKQQGRRCGCCEETAVGGRRMIPESVTESWNGSGRKRPGSSSPNPLLGGKLGGRRQRTRAGKGKRLIQNLQCFSRWFFLLPLVAWAGPGAGKGFASCPEPWETSPCSAQDFSGCPWGHGAADTQLSPGRTFQRVLCQELRSRLRFAGNGSLTPLPTSFPMERGAAAAARVG